MLSFSVRDDERAGHLEIPSQDRSEDARQWLTALPVERSRTNVDEHLDRPAARARLRAAIHGATTSAASIFHSPQLLGAGGDERPCNPPGIPEWYANWDATVKRKGWCAWQESNLRPSD